MSKVTDYGYALYELALEDNIEERIDLEFSKLVDVFQNNDEFIKLLSNPRIKALDRIHILDNVFKNTIHSYLLSMLKILIEKRYISKIDLIYKEFKNKYYESENVLLVNVISAIKLNDIWKDKIIDKMSKLTNKTIIINNKIDKSCIAGIRLEYDGRMIDASVKNRFKKLQHNLTNADYSSSGGPSNEY